MRLLLIDTSTERGIVAYTQDRQILFVREFPFGLSQSKFLMPILAELRQPFGVPEIIGVGIGPGSYTGMRLGVSAAQALAYSWQIPLVGVSSLNGFVPFESDVHFAAILDARIGGVYLRKGCSKQTGVLYHSEPQICSLEEIGEALLGVTHLVTPAAKSLQIKLSKHYSDRQWSWQERAPSVQALMQSVEENYSQGRQIFPPNRLDLLYLRETEAERIKDNR